MTVLGLGCIPTASSVVSHMSNQKEDTMSKQTRILTGAAVAGIVAAAARRLAPKAHEACRAGCGSACGHTTEDTAPDTTVREVQHAA